MYLYGANKSKACFVYFPLRCYNAHQVFSLVNPRANNIWLFSEFHGDTTRLVANFKFVCGKNVCCFLMRSLWIELLIYERFEDDLLHNILLCVWMFFLSVEGSLFLAKINSVMCNRQLQIAHSNTRWWTNVQTKIQTNTEQKINRHKTRKKNRLESACMYYSFHLLWFGFVVKYLQSKYKAPISYERRKMMMMMKKKKMFSSSSNNNSTQTMVWLCVYIWSEIENENQPRQFAAYTASQYLNSSSTNHKNGSVVFFLLLLLLSLYCINENTMVLIFMYLLLLLPSTIYSEQRTHSNSLDISAQLYTVGFNTDILFFTLFGFDPFICLGC